MIERLIRLGLALAVAFVFTGRMEAATAHCAQIVAEEHAVAEPQHDRQLAATPCHGMEEAAAPAPAPHHPASHDPAQSQCECIAVLVGFAPFASPVASANIEPYEWTLPQATVFASIDSSPGLRPPRT
jgi:hypothetical protein